MSFCIVPTRYTQCLGREKPTYDNFGRESHLNFLKEPFREGSEVLPMISFPAFLSRPGLNLPLISTYMVSTHGFIKTLKHSISHPA